MTGPDYIKRYQALESKRADWDSFWEDLGRYVQPRKSEINTVTSYGPDSSSTAFLYDSTAAQSNMTLAMGQMSLVSPSDETWFELKPPRSLEEDDDAISYFREVSTVLREKIAESNFYEEIHEMYLMRGGFGTASLFSANDVDGSLYFRSHDIGTYVICEDAKGRVDTFGRRYPLTASQAVGEFGFERLPEKIQNAANDPKKCDDPYEFIHFVQKRKEIRPGASANERMPWESVHIAYDDKTIVRESGYESFPYHVTRYLRWSDKTTDPYGWCPGWIALPDIRQVNLLQKWMDVLAEVSAFPRTIAPASLEGEIDLRGAGVTYYDPVVDRAKPEEWATGGRYDVGKDRIEVRQAAIEEAIPRRPLQDVREARQASPDVSSRSGGTVLREVDPILSHLPPNGQRVVQPHDSSGSPTAIRSRSFRTHCRPRLDQGHYSGRCDNLRSRHRLHQQDSYGTQESGKLLCDADDGGGHAPVSSRPRHP